MGKIKKEIASGDITLFEKLTRAALGEEDGKAFIGQLLEREKISGLFAGSPCVLDRALAGNLFENELLVIKRLEEERTKLLIEIDLYAQGKRAIRSYSPKFPLPPPLSFFDQKK